MTHVALRFGRAGDDLLVWVDDAPPPFRIDRDMKPFAFMPPPPEDADWLTKAGRGLAEALAALDPALRLLERSAHGTAESLHVTISDPEVNRLPWEALLLGDEFLGLDVKRPVVRRVIDVGDAPSRVVVSSPLRVLALLSAMYQPAADEWAALAAGFGAVRDTIDVRLHVIVGEPELAAAIEAQGLGWVAVERMPDTAEALQRRLVALAEELAPDVIHLYAHGAGKPRVHLGSSAEWGGVMPGIAHEPALGEVVLFADTLAEVARRAGTWLIVVNACQVGSATTEDLSFCEQLVVGGVPVVIGHREPIHPVIAQQLARTVPLAIARTIPATPGEEIPRASHPVAGLLREAREEIAKDAGRRARGDWSLPCLFVHRDDVEIVRGEDTAAGLDASAHRDRGFADAMAQARRAIAGHRLPPDVASTLGLVDVDEPSAPTSDPVAP